MPCILFLVLTFWCWWSTPLLALTVEELAPERYWQVEAVVISGNEAFSARELLATLRTKERPWYTPWKGRPVLTQSPLPLTSNVCSASMRLADTTNAIPGKRDQAIKDLYRE